MPIVQANQLLTMNVWHIYTVWTKNCTIPYFINLISDRANVTVSGPTSFVMLQCKHDYKDKSANY